MNLSVDRPSKSTSLVHQWEIQDPSGWSRCTPIWGCSSIYMWSFNHIPEKNNMGNIDTHVYLYNWGIVYSNIREYSLYIYLNLPMVYFLLGNLEIQQ
jgi:hypothetical protein